MFRCPMTSERPSEQPKRARAVLFEEQEMKRIVTGSPLQSNGRYDEC